MIPSARWYAQINAHGVTFSFESFVEQNAETKRMKSQSEIKKTKCALTRSPVAYNSPKFDRTICRRIDQSTGSLRLPPRRIKIAYAISSMSSEHCRCINPAGTIRI